jgi:sugar (pentulose or hexulose) kinase
VQVSAVKIGSLAAEGLSLSDVRWTNLPDFVAFVLGGQILLDASLTSRIGLMDVESGRAWPALLDHLDVGADFLPPIVEAGFDRGETSVGWLPEQFRGARICVAGHDHLVSSVADGQTSKDVYHASLGTAEVLLRTLDSPLTGQARVRLARHLINCVRHVEPGTWALVAGVKTGLLQRRILQLTGIYDTESRQALDNAIMSMPVEGALGPEVIDVRGARNDDGILALTIRADGVSPAEVFAAALRHGNNELAILMEAMNREVAPATQTILTGGWARMRSVQRARSLVLPSVTVSQREQDTAHGAALFAARLICSNVS